MRSIIALQARPRQIITVGLYQTIPSNALLDDQGRTVLDAQGNFILTIPPV